MPKKIEKPRKFEEYLQDKHAAQYQGLNDEMPDDFNEWITDLGPDEWSDYAEKWQDTYLEAIADVEGLEKIISKHGKTMFVYEIPRLAQEISNRIKGEDVSYLNKICNEQLKEYQESLFKSGMVVMKDGKVIKLEDFLLQRRMKMKCKLIKYFKDREFKKLKKVAELISQYYCEKNGRGLRKEDTMQAGKEINKLGITDLKFKDNKVTIKLKRPGYLIGRRGENIDSLKKYLSVHLQKEIKLYIIEDRLMCWLVPFNYDERYY